MKKSTKIVWGVALIVIGAIIALDRLNVISFDVIFDGWWTLFIIVPCAIGLFQRQNVTGNLIGVIVGVCLLAVHREWLDWDLVGEMIFPLILVALGLGVIFTKKDKETFDESEKEEETLIENPVINEEVGVSNPIQTKKLNVFSVFSGGKSVVDGDKVTGGDVTAIFGGSDCDLTNAVFEGVTKLNVNAIFGGVKLILPENVNVKINPTSIFGGTTNNRNSANDASAPTVYVNAFSMFGGIKIQ
ncbi:MAG: hypothetical protein E7343_05190 [Clostridiales bacterium]|nr:hypothetical protein [Clostridiales bacterium]